MLNHHFLFLLPLMLVVTEASEVTEDDNFCEDPQDPSELCDDTSRKSNLVADLADPSNCHIFWACVHSAGIGFTHHKLECEEGLGFNENLGDFGECDYKQNVPRCNCRPKPVCEKGWKQGGNSCFFLSKEKVPILSDAHEKCRNMNARLAQISNKEENDAVVEMAMANIVGGDDKLDYWIGGKEVENVWQFDEGVPMEYFNWWGDSSDGDKMGKLKGGCIQLLKNGLTDPDDLESYFWARANTNVQCTKPDKDNGFICQKKNM